VAVNGIWGWCEGKRLCAIVRWTCAAWC